MCRRCYSYPIMFVYLHHNTLTSKCPHLIDDFLQWIFFDEFCGRWRTVHTLRRRVFFTVAHCISSHCQSSCTFLTPLLAAVHLLLMMLFIELSLESLKQVTANAVESFIITSIAHYCLNVLNLHCIAETSLGSSFLYVTPLPLRLECFNTSLVKKMSTQALGNLVPLVLTAVTQMLLDSYQ